MVAGESNCTLAFYIHMESQAVGNLHLNSSLCLPVILIIQVIPILTQLLLNSSAYISFCLSIKKIKKITSTRTSWGMDYWAVLVVRKANYSPLKKAYIAQLLPSCLQDTWIWLGLGIVWPPLLYMFSFSFLVASLTKKSALTSVYKFLKPRIVLRYSVDLVFY